jgi:uncharacterized protein (DUF302 family)
MKSKFIPGILVGILLTGIAVYLLMPKLMIRVQQSPADLETTVQMICDSAENQGWVISNIMKIDESVKKHGGGDVPKVRLINFCQPNYAGDILRDSKARHVSVFMPCTISVYEGDGGQVYVSSMNAGLLGRMMGGTIAKVMGGSVSQDQQKVLSVLDQ